MKNETNLKEVIGASSIIAISVFFWVVVLGSIYSGLLVNIVVLIFYTIINVILWWAIEFDLRTSKKKITLRKIIGAIATEAMAVIPCIIIFGIKELLH